MTDELIKAALTRRRFLSLSAAGATIALAGCESSKLDVFPTGPEAVKLERPPVLSDYATMYAPVQDGEFAVPGVPWQKIDQSYLRQVVPNTTGQAAGTLLVDTQGHHIYLTLPNGYAVRYGVGLGRAGFEWSGSGIIQWKQKWPKWTPPAEMIARDPALEKWSAENGGQPGGLKNPLGARAHYIFQDGKDTLFRVHGTPEWSSIGKSVSSGCVRMMNQDVIDLYDRVDKVKKKLPIIVVDGLGSPIVEQRLPSSMPIDSGIPEGAELIGPVSSAPMPRRGDELVGQVDESDVF